VTRLAGAALLALLALGHPASAEETPRIMPTRDVDVIYRIAGPNGLLEQRLRWGVSLGKLRVDPPTPGLFVVIDIASHVVQAVREGDHSVVITDSGNQAMPGVAPSGTFARKGRDKVAGLDCVLWDTKDTTGRIITACLTADGVLLRAEADGLVLVEATDVRFVPQSEAVFRIPADYKKIMPDPVSRQAP
jgi:hypothetical protein